MIDGILDAEAGVSKQQLSQVETEQIIINHAHRRMLSEIIVKESRGLAPLRSGPGVPILPGEA